MIEERQKRILVVDDEEGIQDIFRFTLIQEGYQVSTAGNGVEALDLAAEQLPDLILLDMKMPVMDGWEFAREFYSRYGHDVPIVVITAAADAEKRAEEVQASGWLGKPFDLDYLVALVDQQLKTR